MAKINFQTGLIGLIRFYRYTISLLLGQCCRFTPTCSDYAIQAIRKEGSLRGGWLAIKRLSRCHPWHPGGIDTLDNRHK